MQKPSGSLSAHLLGKGPWKSPTEAQGGRQAQIARFGKSFLKMIEFHSSALRQAVPRKVIKIVIKVLPVFRLFIGGGLDGTHEDLEGAESRCRSLNETVHSAMPWACGCQLVSVIAAGGVAFTLLRSGRLGGSASPPPDTPPLAG